MVQDFMQKSFKTSLDKSPFTFVFVSLLIYKENNFVNFVQYIVFEWSYNHYILCLAVLKLRS